MGNFVNYIEITPENVQQHLLQEKEESNNESQQQELEKQQAKRAIRHPANKLRVDLRYLDQEVIPCGVD